MPKPQAMVSAEHELTVPFYDVDSMEIVWHGNYLKYFEQARCVLLDKINYNYQSMRDSGYAWPVIDVRVKYIKPLRFNQAVVIAVDLIEYENRLKLSYCIRDKESGIKLCDGYSVQVAVDMKNGEMQFVSPEILVERIQACQSKN